jgi:hypothetical protein
MLVEWGPEKKNGKCSLSTFFNHYLEVEDVCEPFDLILYTNQKFDFEAEKEQIVFEQIKKKLSKTVRKNVLLFSLFRINFPYFYFNMVFCGYLLHEWIMRQIKLTKKFRHEVARSSV